MSADRYELIARVELDAWEITETDIWRSDFDMVLGDLNGHHVRISTVGEPEDVEHKIVCGARVFAQNVHGLDAKPADLRALKNVTDGR